MSMPWAKGQERLNRKRLLLVPMGQIEEPLLAWLAPILGGCFPVAPWSAPRVPIPPEAYCPERDQYSSLAILEALSRNRPRQAGRVLALVEVDLFVAPLNFVFGTADPAGLAVVSLARLDPRFYGQKYRKRILWERAAKEAVHELGHTYGLGHCGHPGCVMSFSNSLAEADVKFREFCPRCRRQLLGKGEP